MQRLEVRKHFLEGLSKHRGSIYAPSMFSQYPNYAHRILNVSPGLILGEGVYIQKSIWVSLEGLIFRVGGDTQGFTIYGLANEHEKVAALILQLLLLTSIQDILCCCIESIFRRIFSYSYKK